MSQNYKLTLTDNDNNILFSRIVSDLNLLINIFTTNILPIINRRYYDDNFPSITVTTNKTVCSYSFHSSNNWSRKIQAAEFILNLLPEKLNLSWPDLINDWTLLLFERYPIYQWVFTRVDVVHLEQLEPLFGRSVYFKRNINKLILIIEPIIP
jgi:hypothetical protein